MAVRDDRSDVKQTTTGFRGPLMVQSLTSAKSKFLSLDDSEISDLIAKYPGIMYMFDNNNLDECIKNICEIIKNRNSKIINNIALEYASQHLDKEVILPKFAESILLKNIN